MAIVAEERFDRELNALRFVSRCIEDTDMITGKERDYLLQKLKRDDERGEGNSFYCHDGQCGVRRP